MEIRALFTLALGQGDDEAGTDCRSKSTIAASGAAVLTLTRPPSTEIAVGV